MEPIDFLNAGFFATDDPQFVFEYDLSEKAENYQDEECKPALLYDHTSSQFCVTDGEIMFIYFNSENPFEAIEWANKITSFSPN